VFQAYLRVNGVSNIDLVVVWCFLLWGYSNVFLFEPSETDRVYPLSFARFSCRSRKVA
jgi:hypothetical protein